MENMFVNKLVKKKFIHFHAKDSHGIATLPFVVGVLIITGVGGLALLSTSFRGLNTSIRDEQSRQARAIAEEGTARTIEALNSQYSYRLIQCYVSTGNTLPTENSCADTGLWSSAVTSTAVCPSATTGAPLVEQDTTSPTGKYEIEYYSFNGSSSYGGTGLLKVIGYRQDANNDTILATATVETTFDVEPKPCNSSIDSEPTSSGFPGLMANAVSMGGNDVIGATSGNVLCIECTRPDYTDTDNDGFITADEYTNQNKPVIGCNTQCAIGGEIFVSDIALPDVPTFPTVPSNLTAPTNISDINLKSGDLTISAGSDNNGRCTVIDSVTHCKVVDIVGSGKNKLYVNTNSGPVNFYISGDVSLSGKSGIIQNNTTVSDPLDISPLDLNLYGLPTSTDSRCTTDSSFMAQDIAISGGSSGSNLFAFFPCGQVGINGGAKENCDDENDDQCAGGDIRGAVWAKKWQASSGNRAQLNVPPNMGEELTKENGPDFSVSIGDYAGVGAKQSSFFGN